MIRRELWQELTSLIQGNPGPWLMVGDYNAILGAHEQRGGGIPLLASCDDFKVWFYTCVLTHLPTRGTEYTWSNGRRAAAHTERRLDRGICNDSWLQYWSSTTCCALTRTQSDHHPLLLTMAKGIQTFPSSFKFLSMWPKHSDCRRLVHDTWNQEVVGCPMYRLSQKLKFMKLAFKSWNKTIFGDVHKMVDDAKTALDAVQQEIADLGYSDSLNDCELAAQKQYHTALSYQEAFWKEKARVNWFNHGDRNTSYFHKLTKIRNSSKRMTALKSEETILDTQSDIEQHVLNYYSSLYASENSCVNSDFIDRVILSLVTTDDNVVLTGIPTLEEVRMAVFAMNGDSAPGPDGFNGNFFQTYWDAMGNDVFLSVLQFLHRGGSCLT